MNNTALITGASSGIGKELARRHASKGGDLIVVARRLEALHKLKAELEAEHNVSVVCIAADLTEPETPQNIYEQVQSRDAEVDVLINNAGFGGHGKFHERNWKRDEAMIRLNVMALTELTHLFVKDMLVRKRGMILNVASTAGFLPGPLQAVYYATKAFVLSFSQAIAEELRDENITVTVLCPGPVATEFTSVADMEHVVAFKNASSPASVAEVGYEAMIKGKLVAINDWKLSLMLNWIVPFLPRRTVLKLSRRLMEKRGRPLP
ncbi:MAG: SDR family oxidoreductase [Planctomycetes bacterium]|nr:SDR family oxidoreductase [Planctomycetota bacterium]